MIDHVITDVNSNRHASDVQKRANAWRSFERHVQRYYRERIDKMFSKAEQEAFEKDIDSNMSKFMEETRARLWKDMPEEYELVRNDLKEERMHNELNEKIRKLREGEPNDGK